MARQTKPAPAKQPVRKTYVARVSRSGGWWAVEVPQLKGVFTQVRRLDRAEEMAREAIAAYLDTQPKAFDVRLDIELPVAPARALVQLVEARDHAEQARRKAAVAATNAARAMTAAGLTVREAAAAMGMSYQRVHQLLHP